MKRYLLPFYKNEAENLYNYIKNKYAPFGIEKGLLNRINGEYIGFFGTVKFIESLIFLYKFTKNKKYLDDFKKLIKFCQSKAVKRGIEDFWRVSDGKGSDWIESNHLGIVAFSIYLYYKETNDKSFNDFAIFLMKQIPKINGSGQFIQGYNKDMSKTDARSYLADHSEMLLGFWACYNMTGDITYKNYYKGIYEFFDDNIKAIPSEEPYRAWLVGPYHINYGDGTSNEVYCDESHTTYEQFFISRDIVMTEEEKEYDNMRDSCEWANNIAKFDDSLYGYNRRDNKMIGWSGYISALNYWVYLTEKDERYYRQSIETLNRILDFKNSEGGYESIIMLDHSIDWEDMENNCAGLGSIWQQNSILETFAITEALDNKEFSLWKLDKSNSRVKEIVYDDKERSLLVKIFNPLLEVNEFKLISKKDIKDIVIKGEKIKFRKERMDFYFSIKPYEEDFEVEILF